MLTRRQLAAAALAGGLLATTAAGAAEPKMPVVASFSILADIIRRVGRDRVEVTSLVGPDADAHSFEPKPEDAARVASAKLFVVNGLGFEGWLGRLGKAVGGQVKTVTASAGIQPLREGRELDPHAFGDPRNVVRYVATVAAALVAADPAGRDAYESNAAAYTTELETLDRDTRAAIDRIPPERRRLITSHDAFGYFAKAYGLTVLAPAGVSTEAELSARDVARVVRQIRQERIPAVFLENVSDPRLMQQISRESGAKVGGQLFSDALSPPSGPAGTYLDLVRSNTRTITAALAP